MKLMPLAVIAGLLSPVMIQAADRDFNDIVRVISDQFHTRPEHIPMFGLVNAFTFVARPAGTRHIDLAIFDDLGARDRDGRSTMDSIRNAIGGSWKPFVEVRSSRPEQGNVLVYLRQQGHDWKMLIASIEPDDATVVQLQLDADALARWLQVPEYCARHWSDGASQRGNAR
jgi:hypothetical protein